VKTAEERFWGKVDKHGPYPKKKVCKIHPEIAGTNCWIWTGYTMFGYGQFKDRLDTGYYRQVRVHRFSYELEYGKRSLGKKQCCHKCDRKRCVRPLHLFKGTNDDNVYDRNIKGRQAKGEQHGNAKLTALQARVIRSLHALGECSYGELGRKFEVSKTVANGIVNRRAWKHV
jgi:hypothetical protein